MGDKDCQRNLCLKYYLKLLLHFLYYSLTVETHKRTGNQFRMDWMCSNNLRRKTVVHKSYIAFVNRINSIRQCCTTKNLGNTRQVQRQTRKMFFYDTVSLKMTEIHEELIRKLSLAA